MLLIGPNGILQIAPVNRYQLHSRYIERISSPEPSELLQPMVPLMLHERVGDELYDLCAIGYAVCVRVELRIGCELRTLENFGGEKVELQDARVE